MAESAELEGVKFTLNAVINRERTRVLFAEVDSDLADVLLSFLTLPLGTIVRLLQKHYGGQAAVFGSLSTLYNGLANLDNVHFWTEGGKLMLLNPRSSFEAECRKLKLNLDDTEVTKYFCCARCSSPRRICMYYFSCRHCGKTENGEIGKGDSKTQTANGDGVFITKTASLVITDDMRMVPNVERPFVQTLSNLGITDTTGIKLRTVTVGFNEIMDLLKGSLLSSTLTDLFLNNTQTEPVNPAAREEIIMPREEEINPERMNLKVIVQTSTGRFLFAQAQENFIDFLLCFLTIPLGGVEQLLEGNSGLRNIDNLYRSLDNLNDCLVLQDFKNSLLKLAPMYLSKNQFFPLTEQKISQLYPEKIMDPKGLHGSYVRGQSTYIVTDDLTVTPMLLSSILSMLDEMQVQLVDVEEREVQIGLKEGLSILKASLTSTRALSDGLHLNRPPTAGAEI